MTSRCRSGAGNPSSATRSSPPCATSPRSVPRLLIAGGDAPVGAYAVEVTGPELSFTLDVADFVAVHNGSAPGDAPLLRGDAVELIEALSIRAPLPDSTPAEWRALLHGLETVFDAVAR